MREIFSADPTVVFLTAVLADISDGNIKIPRFQRPLVWSWVQRRDFLGSIFEGLPIGALMLWNTSNQDIGCYEHLGPHKLNVDKKAPEQRYLMDGVQRVSTLYGALFARDEWSQFDYESDSEVVDFVVYADLDAVPEGDIFKRKIDIGESEMRADPSRFLPMNIILELKDVLRFQRSIPDEYEHRIDAVEEIVSAFRDYKLPIISLKSASLEVVTKSFERLNSRGAAMSEIHMLNALSYGPEFDFLQLDQELRTKHLAQSGWRDIDSEIVLRCLKSGLGLDIYTKNPEVLSSQLNGDKGKLADIYRSIGDAAVFFRKGFGIKSPNLVPYRMQIVAAATSFLLLRSEDIVDRLSDWIWFSTYTELFGGPGRQSEDALNSVYRFLRGESNFESGFREAPAIRHPGKVRCDFRSARVKALAFAMCHKLELEGASGLELMRDYGGNAFVALPGEMSDRSKSGLRFMMPPADVAGFRNRMAKASLSDKEMNNHFIDEGLIGILEGGDVQRFYEARADRIFEFEKEEILEPIARRLGVPELRYV